MLHSIRKSQSALAAVCAGGSRLCRVGEHVQWGESGELPVAATRSVETERGSPNTHAEGQGAWQLANSTIPSRECGARYWAGSSSSLTRNCSHFVGSSRPATSPIRSFGFDQCHIAKLTKRWSPRLRTVTLSTPRCADSTSVLLCPRDNHTRGPNYPPSKYGTPLFHFVPPCSTSDTNRGTPTVPFFGKVFHRPDRNGTLWNTMEQLTR